MTFSQAIYIIVGILAAPSSFAGDGVFTGNYTQDWSFVRGKYMQDPKDRKQCDEKSLYLEPGLKRALNEYLGPPPKDSQAVRGTPQTPPPSCRQRGLSSYQSSPFPELIELASEIDPLLAVTPKDVACVAAAQKSYMDREGRNTKYVDCAGVKATQVANPCRSEAYVTASARAFSMVSECLGADSRELFRIFVKESGMNVNPVSPTGAAGISQMTGIAILHVQDVEEGREGTAASRALHKKFEENLNGVPPHQPPNPHCGPLRDFEKIRYSKETAGKDCSILSMPNALFVPAYLGMKHYLYYKSEVEASARSDGLSQVFGEDYEEIIRATSAYSFSAAGHYATLPVFQTLARLYRGKYVPGKSKGEFLAHLRSRMMEKRPSVAEEIKTLVSDDGKVAEDHYQSIRSQLGGAECF